MWLCPALEFYTLVQLRLRNSDTWKACDEECQELSLCLIAKCVAQLLDKDRVLVLKWSVQLGVYVNQKEMYLSSDFFQSSSVTGVGFCTKFRTSILQFSSVLLRDSLYIKLFYEL